MLDRSSKAPTASRVLVIDDDRKLCRLIAEYLKPMGYDVEAVHTGPEGVERGLEDEWEAIILDVMLPEIDGFEVLRSIRARSAVPVLMLTSMGEEVDRIVGLESGADDYLPKTFSTRELLARLRAVVRRSHLTLLKDESGLQPVIAVAELRIDPNTCSASLGDEPLGLTPVEYAILESLARARGRVKSRDALLEEIRDRSYEVFDRSIDVHISSLRRKLSDDPKNPRFIRTVRSVGYLFLKD